MAIKIEHATASGFCDGVRRAVDLAEEALRSGKVLWADGPLVHNTQMVNALHEEGMEHISDICQLPHGATFIVRAHGISPAKWQTLQEISKKRDLKLIDATCPCVQRVFQIAEYYASQNFPVVILGERDHPEVEAARAWAGEKGYIVSDYAELRTLFPDYMKSFALLAQTTLPQSFFYAFSEQLRRDFPNCVVLDTICAAT
ncbi:MAG: hypothetical protein FWE76_02230, partial [Symbiobacteriaceae bacterium]|nr:hypothetical protein [Symbiobacteriaceae bacterium]